MDVKKKRRNSFWLIICVALLVSPHSFGAKVRQSLQYLVLAQQMNIATTKASPLLDQSGRELYGPAHPSVSLGMTSDRIVFGQSAALSGSSGAIGLGVRLGINTAFAEINKKGGVHGRKLSLITLDDGYVPERAIDNTRRLIDEEQVFALMGAVGTSTARAAIPVAKAAGVPFIGPVTGNETLIQTRWSNMVQLRASYNEETEAMVERLVNDLDIERIAVMYQNDSFGRDVYSGIRLALSRRELAPVSSGTYERNTSAIKTALVNIKGGRPEAVILVGNHEAIANFVRWSRHAGLKSVFMAISFVGIQALSETLGSDGRGIFVTQVVPFPSASSDIPVTNSFLKALAAFAPEAMPDFTSFEGYLIGRLAIEGLRNSGRLPTREDFLAYFSKGPIIDLEGFNLYYDKSIDKGSDSVYLMVIDDAGRYRSVRALTDAGQ